MSFERWNQFVESYKAEMQSRKEQEQSMKNNRCEEMETTMNFTRTDKEVSIWTNDTVMYTKFDKLCTTAPDIYQCTEVGRDRDGDIISKTYRMADKSLLSFRTRHIKRELTPEQRAVLSERSKRNRANQAQGKT